MVARFLITTADERSWRTDRPVLFLGEWCRLYDRRHVWSNLDAQVVPYHWDDREQFYRDCLYLQDLYEQLLSELGAALNQFHGVDHSSRYWRILVGPWLAFFIQVIFDRWTMIQRAVQKFEIEGTVVLEPPWEHTIPLSFIHFDSLVRTDAGNHIIYSRILQGWTNVRCERIPAVAPPDIVQSPAAPVSLSLRQRLAPLMKRGLILLSAMLGRQTDAFMIGTYLHLKFNIRLQMALGQIPQLWSRMPLSQIKPDRRVRERFRLGIKGAAGFEQCVRTLLAEQIPAVYLEGYRQLQATVASLPWPKRPRVIFTSSNHNSDDVFKAWAAEKTESDIPLVIGQHGGGYGCGLWEFDEKHELAIADRYLTWGWGEGDAKLMPTGALKLLALGPGAWDKDGDLLLVMAGLPRYSYVLGPFIISATQFESYLSDVYQFVDALDNVPRQRLLVRAYMHNYGWSQTERWHDRYADVRLDPGTGPIEPLIRQSRLYIATYNATTFLETLGRNIPTIMFWNPKHWELRASAKPYFDRLKEVGILHETPKSAAAKVAEVWNDVPGWWQQTKIQEARLYFCNRFARMPENPLALLKDALTTVRT